MKKLVAIHSHVSNFPHPVEFQKGDRLNIGKKETEFKGWIWVIDKYKNEGWAPMQYIHQQKEEKWTEKL